MSGDCDILVVSPHPDDADLFCGATLASWVTAGLGVRVVDLTAGELSTNGDVGSRRAESAAALVALGIEGERENLGLLDGELDHRSMPHREALVGLIRRLQPRLLVGPWREDRHPDHREASLLVRDAHFWSGVAKFSPRLGRPFRADRLLYYPCHGDAPVNVFVDVTRSMDAWESAVDCYASQTERVEGRRPTFLNREGFRSGLRARRRQWGEQSGVHWAEAFISEGRVAVEADALFPRSNEGGES